MSNKIKLGRATKERLEEIKDDLQNYEIVYSKDTKEIGIKNEDGTITFIGKASEKIIPNHKLLMVNLDRVSEEQETILDPVFIMNSQDFGINIDDIVFVIDNITDGNIVGYCRVFGVNEDNTEVTLTKIKNIGTISIDLTDYIKKSDASPLVVPDTVVSRRPDGLFDVGTPLYPESPVNLLYTDVILTKKTELNKELSQVYGDKNLARPNLDGKEYLGNGVYMLYNANGITLDYNVYSGIYTINGTALTNGYYGYLFIPTNLSGDMMLKLYVVNDDVFNKENVIIETQLSPNYSTHINNYISGVPYDYTNQNTSSLYIVGGIIFNNFQFKLQFEKGDTATPYTIPAPFVLPHELTSGEWITPTLLNGWTNVASNELQYRKDINGNVQLRGHLNGGTLETVIATLPEGFRPLKTTYFICSTDLTIGSGKIGTNGNITLIQGDLTNVRLDTISFSTL